MPRWPTRARPTVVVVLRTGTTLRGALTSRWPLTLGDTEHLDGPRTPAFMPGAPTTIPRLVRRGDYMPLPPGAGTGAPTTEGQGALTS